VTDAFGRAMTESAAAWRSMVSGPPAQEAGPLKREITLDPGALDCDGRAQLAAYLHEAAGRTNTAGGPVAELIASCVDAIGDKTAAGTGPITVKVTALGAEEQMMVRRVLWSAADRARSGTADTSSAVRDGMERLTEQWGRAIGYDAKPGWTGPRNRWAEPGSGLRPSVVTADDGGWR